MCGLIVQAIYKLSCMTSENVIHVCQKGNFVLHKSIYTMMNKEHETFRGFVYHHIT